MRHSLQGTKQPCHAQITCRKTIELQGVLLAVWHLELATWQIEVRAVERLQVITNCIHVAWDEMLPEAFTMPFLW